MNKLNVFYEKQKVGELHKDNELVLSFQYEPAWLSSPNSFALSLSMPLTSEKFGNKVTLSFFENLLPEGKVRDDLEKAFEIEGAFEFLKKFGNDCAGAIIISANKESPFKNQGNNKKEIDTEKIFDALKNRYSVAETIAEINSGYLSLAGAQDKFATIYEGEKLYLPIQGGATTHIVKVPITRSGINESVFNEFYCMSLASEIGLNIPNCLVIKNSEYPLFVIERYDRIIEKNNVQRLHQQDFCQAQGFVSENKYETKGGPSIKNNYDLIVKNVGIKKRAQNAYSFLDWLCFNLLIGNNDSHSKNISLVIKDSKIELAPFYDLLCTAIYPKLKNEFSFNIGGRNQCDKIGKKQFLQLESELGLKSGALIEQMQLVNEKIMAKKDKLAHLHSEMFPNMKIAKRISDLIGIDLKV